MTERAFVVHIEGFNPYLVYAENAGRARMNAFYALTEAWTDVTFRDFIDMVSVKRASVSECHRLEDASP